VRHHRQGLGGRLGHPPHPGPAHRKKVAVVGSGPAGLAAADQLNQAGHTVTVFERADRIGGLLMYGIPNMKLDKETVVLRRVDLMAAEGVVFKTGVNIGRDREWTPPNCRGLRRHHPVLRRHARPRPAGRGPRRPGIHLAMEFLTANTRHQLEHLRRHPPALNAAGKDVVVIGGGDTGTDCVGTGLAPRLQERGPTRNPAQAAGFERAPDNPWPEWPKVYKMDYGQEEAAAVQGADPRQFLVLTKRFIKDANGDLSGLEICDIEWAKDDQGRFAPREGARHRARNPGAARVAGDGFPRPRAGNRQPVRAGDRPRTNVQAAYGNFATNLPGVLPPATCAAGSPWWCGPSTKAAPPPASATASSWA
jgi:glutamate synthase (NADPH) small chain